MRLDFFTKQIYVIGNLLPNSASVFVFQRTDLEIIKRKIIIVLKENSKNQKIELRK